MAELTHIVPGHATSLGRGPNGRPAFRSLCGEVCEDLHHVSHDPTCPECRRIDEDDERSLLALRQMPPVNPPRQFPAFNDLNKKTQCYVTADAYAEHFAHDPADVTPLRRKR